MKTKKIILKDFINWKFYYDLPVRVLFIHILLLSDNKGQLITSLSKLSVETGITVKQIRTAIDKLKYSKHIKISIGQGFGKLKTCINVCEYELYVDKKKPKVKKKAQLTEFSKDVNDIYENILPFFPDNVTISLKNENNKNKWKDELRKLIEIDKHDAEEIINVIKFARTNDFWKQNFLSVMKLRQLNREKIKYFIVFQEQMKIKQNKTKIIIRKKNPYKINEEIKKSPNRMKI